MYYLSHIYVSAILKSAYLHILAVHAEEDIFNSLASEQGWQSFKEEQEEL